MANRRVYTWLAVGALLLGALGGCGKEVSGTAKPVAGGASMVDATSSAPSSHASSSAPTTSKPKSSPKADSGGDTDFQVTIGECVRLGGTNDNATIDHASCGSKESNYRVIGKAHTNAECISDADAYYAETLGGKETGALCLDIDWAVDSCMDLSGDDPLRIECNAPGADSVRVVAIQQNTDTVDNCPTQGGFVYDQRHFVVCTEDL